MATTTIERKDRQALLAAAKEYVDKQLATMREYGSAPNLSAEAYENLIQKVAAASMR